MTDVWSERAEAFRESAVHRESPDLDLLVEWCEPGALRARELLADRTEDGRVLFRSLVLKGRT